VGAGIIITSAGSFRGPNEAVRAGRSATSMHYSGLAFDLATTSGMRDPAVDPYIVTQDGDYWRVWARTDEGLEQQLDAVVHVNGVNGAIHTQEVTARVADFTALAASYGFRRIGPRSDFPANYLSAEWWHFQCEDVLVPWISQFGIELLSLDIYTEATLPPANPPATTMSGLQGIASLWNNRKRIFGRMPTAVGWH